MIGLRNGFTTGACAAAAAKAAALALCGNPPPTTVEITLSEQERERFSILFVRSAGNGFEAAVQKDAGDDPDLTNGVEVRVHVSFAADGLMRFEAGVGVGRVTKPGLSVPPGEPAINPGPRRMIATALAEVSDRGFRVCVSIPGGAEIAQKTFNPRLGIVDGLSVLGTTGHVRPFSAVALLDSLRCSLDVADACGVRAPVLVPGNIGERAARRHFRLGPEQVIEVSNLWGDMLDEAARHGFERLLIVGHPGKLAKLAVGEWNTHSENSASAVPVVTALAEKLFQKPVLDSVTVEGVFQAMETSWRRELGCRLSGEIRQRVIARLDGRFDPAVVLINMKGDILGTDGDLEPWI